MRRVELKSPWSCLYGHHSIDVRHMVFMRLQSVEKPIGLPLWVFWDTQLLEAGRRLAAGKAKKRGVDEVESQLQVQIYHHVLHYDILHVIQNTLVFHYNAFILYSESYLPTMAPMLNGLFSKVVRLRRQNIVTLFGNQIMRLKQGSGRSIEVVGGRGVTVYEQTCTCKKSLITNP